MSNVRDDQDWQTTPGIEGGYRQTDNLTRRDIFAIAALQGLLVNHYTTFDFSQIANIAYQLADAMEARR